MKTSFASLKSLERQHLDEALNAVFQASKVGRPDFRVSSFPYCPLLELRAMQEKLTTIDYRQQFYLSVGTAVHDLWQQAMTSSPKFGHKVFGNWFCVRCKKRRLFQTKPEKACCSGGWGYEEIPYKYDELTGHSDLLTRENSDNYTMWELKTVPAWFLNSQKPCAEYPMFAKSLNQARLYSFLARKVYNLSVTKIVIVHLGRENPDPENSRIQVQKFDVDDYRRIERQLKRAEKGRKAVTKFLAGGKNLSQVIETRPCHNKKEYTKRMDWAFYGSSKCPMSEICTQEERVGDLKTILSSP